MDDFGFCFFSLCYDFKTVGEEGESERAVEDLVAWLSFFFLFFFFAGTGKTGGRREGGSGR